jgi:hypothetical protein
MHAIKALYYISRLFGLAPFKLRNQHITRKVICDTKLRGNALYSFWSLFLLILMVFGGIMQINVIIECYSERERFVTELSSLFSFVSSTASLIIVNSKRDLVPLILKQLNKFDIDLLEYEDHVKKSRRSQYVFVTKICILLFPAVLCLPLSFISFVETNGLLNLTLVWTSYLYPQWY